MAITISKPTEKQIQDAVLDTLRLHGAVAIRVNNGMIPLEYKGRRRVFRGTDTQGVADILACYRGKFLAIEVKRPGGKQRPTQLEFQASIDRAGGSYFVVTDWRQVGQILKAVEP